jgi:uncharacterized protein
MVRCLAASSKAEAFAALCTFFRYPYNVWIMRFAWDPAKAASNLRKHGVSFEEAQSVFYDDFAMQFFDDGHSSGESRFLLLGMSASAHVLLVCHCERGRGEVIRIISARKATRHERAFYRR